MRPMMITLNFHLKKRYIRALRAAGLHLLLSAIVAAVTAWFVFGYWFPAPLGDLMGGAELFRLIVSVDVICGPLLTLVVFNPAKPLGELRRDLAVVTLIQLIALGYGVHTLGYTRPIALVHEVDRFRLVGFADLDQVDAGRAPNWAKPWGFSRPRTVGLRPTESSYEAKMASINAALQGIEPSQRPSQWQDYALSVSQVLERAHPIDELHTKHPTEAGLLNAAVRSALLDAKQGETNDADALRWLPLVSRRATDWVVLLDPVTARVRGYAHLDGF